jgi:hypothetical protein
MSLNENEHGYSFKWSKYKGDYDKYEYDIKTKSGEVILNCYPNAGKFNLNWGVRKQVHEEDVSEIKISTKPQLGINPRYWYNDDYKGNFRKWKEKHDD